MFNHASQNYICPICLGVGGVENEHTFLKQADLVYQDELVTAFINSFWMETVEGHIIVVSNSHHEHLYDTPAQVGHRIFDVSQKLAISMRKAYPCEGSTIRQNNEPAGDQHAFHFHLHIFPRYRDDKLNENMKKKTILSDPKDRVVYANKIKRELLTSRDSNI